MIAPRLPKIGLDFKRGLCYKELSVRKTLHWRAREMEAQPSYEIYHDNSAMASIRDDEYIVSDNPTAREI